MKLSHRSFHFRNNAPILTRWFILLVFLAGIFGYKNYGISWDENTQRNSGVVFVNHIQQKLNLGWIHIPPNVPALEDYRDKEFGAAFEIFLFVSERFLGLSDYRDIFLFRHLVNFLLFWIGIIVFAFILKKTFKDDRLVLIGCIILVLQPRIFADAFYNSKDIPLMVSFIISLYFFIRLHQRGNFRDLICLALFAALTFNIRPIGIIIPLIAFLILLPVALYGKGKAPGHKRWLAIWITLPVLFMILVWLTNPYLWDDPFLKSYAIIRKFLNYDVSHTAGNMIFLGHYIPTFRPPWYYLPLWIGITTPVLYLVLFVAGLIILIAKSRSASMNHFHETRSATTLFILGWLVLPLTVAVLFRSTLYDGWRHFYFIWPAMVYIALIGTESLLKQQLNRGTGYWKKLVRTFFLVFVFSFLSVTGWNLYHWHPHQYCYFNCISPAPSANFELDYWGVSYRDALEYLVKTDQSGQIRIRTLNLPGYLNAFLLDPETRKRLFFHYSLRENFSTRIDSYFPCGAAPQIMKPGEEAIYYISNFRDTSSPEEIRRYHAHEFPYNRKIYSLEVDKLEIMGVYRIIP